MDESVGQIVQRHGFSILSRRRAIDRSRIDVSNNQRTDVAPNVRDAAEATPLLEHRSAATLTWLRAQPLNTASGVGLARGGGDVASGEMQEAGTDVGG